METVMETRTLGRSGIEVGPLGMGTWAIGGPFAAGDQPLGWGEVDDAESVRTVHRALDAGVTFFDTADVYGTGHAERILGQALRGRRDRVVIATKWGNVFDERTRQLTGEDPSPGYAPEALKRSLARLGTDHVDVWQLHLSGLDPAAAEDLVEVCEDMVAAGLTRCYGWSTDDPARAAVFAAGPHCAVVQHALNVLTDAPEMLALCDRYDLASVNRSPLAMGLLTDKVTARTRLAADDVRGRQPEWLQWFTDGRPTAEWLARRDAVREILTSGGRTLAQGALAWIWARSPRTVPIAGCRTPAQVADNAGALRHGPLTPDQLAEVDRLLGRVPA
jgi:aryl-alcohol dehydrogenase-like predicted oxidoreductase